MRKTLLFFLFLCLWMAPFSIWANPVRSSHTEAELVAEDLSIQPGRNFAVGLRLKMDEGWHTYWRNPGDSGLPTVMTWVLPEGFRVLETEWPAPEKFDLPPLSVYGYEGEVLIVTKIAPPPVRSALPVLLELRASWLECKVNCLPGEAVLNLELPVSDDPPAVDSRWADLFDETRRRLPCLTDDWKVTARYNTRKILLTIHYRGQGDPPFSAVEFFPFSDSVIRHAAPVGFRREGGIYRLGLERSEFSSGDLAHLDGLLVFRSPGGRTEEPRLKAVEFGIIPEKTEVLEDLPSPAQAPGMPFPGAAGLKLTAGMALVFAFLGGLILNLMPCVLPVLSIKVLNLIEQANENKTGAWRHGVSFSAGVLFSFWALAGLLLALRAFGHELGWGFQLQSPRFVFLLAMLFFVAALNFFGIFEIGVSLTSLGGQFSGIRGITGSFLSGVLATIVATPCTAPFMGAALGFALIQPPGMTFLIFGFLGLGMALPYFLLTVYPGLLSRVPKPGPWMVTLKKIMGIFLFATVVWLLSVLDRQAAFASRMPVWAGFLLAAAGFWIYGKAAFQAEKPPKKTAAMAVAFLLIAGGILLPLLGLRERGTEEGVRVTTGQGIAWETFSPGRLEELLSEGRPVLINFTAAWCLTCYVNEKIAFSSPALAEKFRDLNVAALKADWTRRDAEITRAIRGYGRSGVPLYVLYGSESGETPSILPELITPEIVLEALDKIQSPSPQGG